MRWLLLPVLLGSLSACALSEDVAPIAYSPGPATPLAGAQPVALSTADGRTADRTRISTKINGYGMEMAAIRSERPITDVVQDAIAHEFEARGFHVDSVGRHVDVVVTRFYNQYHVGLINGTADGEVALSVTVSAPPGPPIYAHDYLGKSHSPIMLANGSNAAASVAAALKDAVNQMFADPTFVGALTSRVGAAVQRAAPVTG